MCFDSSSLNPYFYDPVEVVLLDGYDPASHQVFSQKHGESLRKSGAWPDVFCHMEALSASITRLSFPGENVKVDAYLLAGWLVDLPIFASIMDLGPLTVRQQPQQRLHLTYPVS